jgi:DNA-binding transcriptional ArsR family regulator
MSKRRYSRRAALRKRATVFAALGDETRLSMLGRLASGQAQSISRLTAGTNLTRQAVTKHLRVLEGAGIVRLVRSGRESRFGLQPEPLGAAREYLEGGFQTMGRRAGPAKTIRGRIAKKVQSIPFRAGQPETPAHQPGLPGSKARMLVFAMEVSFRALRAETAAQ